MNDTKLHYDDIAIVPEILTEIESRSECNPCDENDMLPIFASCMSSVVSMENYQDFIDAQINPVIPRTYGLKERLRFVAQHPDIFVAFSLAETIDVFVTGYNNAMVDVCNEGYELKTMKICIDMANGHMKKLIETVKKIKKIYGDRISVMTGNIANPKTYEEYAKAGVDIARFSIGTGNCCFVEGTKITMADGSKINIEDVDKGDFVLTKNGAYRVINTYTQNTQETIKINNEIECTPNHKFFVVRKKDIINNITNEYIKKVGFWLEASKLTNEYLLVQE